MNSHEKKNPLSGQGKGAMIGTTNNPSLSSPLDIVNSKIQNLLENEFHGLDFGIVRLELHVRDGRICRYAVSREQSYVPGGAE